MSTADRILLLTNDARRAHHLPPLKGHWVLNRSAGAKAGLMARTMILDHGDWAPMIWRIVGRHRFGALGENIAYGQTDADQVVADWMASPHHRANILGADYSWLGSGVARAADGDLYWCQQFGGR